MSNGQTLIDYSRWIQKWDLSPVVERPLSPPKDKAARTVSRGPMWVFVSGESRLVSRVPVSVEVSEEAPDEDFSRAAFVFRCKRLHVFASAEAYEDAENLFHEQVVHFFRAYIALGEAEVTEDAAQIRDLYLKNFEESAGAQ